MSPGMYSPQIYNLFNAYVGLRISRAIVVLQAKQLRLLVICGVVDEPLASRMVILSRIFLNDSWCVCVV